jgi:hypothetical protein
MGKAVLDFSSTEEGNFKFEAALTADPHLDDPAIVQVDIAQYTPVSGEHNEYVRLQGILTVKQVKTLHKWLGLVLGQLEESG